MLGVLGRPVEMGIAFLLLISPGWTALLYAGAIAEERRVIGDDAAALPRWRRSVGLSAVPGSLDCAAGYLAAAGGAICALRGVGRASRRHSGRGCGGAIALYAYPLIALHGAALFNALRNGLILASRYPSNTLGLLGMAVLGGLAVGYVGVALLFFLPAWYGLFVVNNCRLVVERELGDD